MNFESDETSTLITLPASVAKFLIKDHSSADHIRTLQSNPAVIKNNPDLGNSPEVGPADVVISISPFASPLLVGSGRASGGASSGRAVATAGRGAVGSETSSGTWGSSSDDRKNFRSETDDLCAGIIYCVLRARRSHIRTVSSPDPVAI